jgi:hypothetical protein
MSPIFPLPGIPADKSASTALPEFNECGLAAMLDLVVDAPSWADRWPVLSAFWHSPHKSTFEVEATTRMLTSIGEQIGKRSVECIEAAAFYRVTMHASWRLAAMRWLDAADADAVSAFMTGNPEYQTFFLHHVALYPPRSH